jgi:hypothetical protein
MRHFRFGTAVLGTMVLVAGLGGDARAAAVKAGGVGLPVPPSPPIGNGWDYAMSAYLVPPSSGMGTEITNGELIQLFDVQGLDIASAVTVSGGPFLFDFSNTGPLPPSLSFSDDPSIPNLVLTYSGPTLTALPGGEPVLIGDFGFNTFGFPLAPGFNFAAETSGPAEGVSYGFAMITSVPEPATWVLVLTALPAAFWIRRGRGARAVSTGTTSA